MNHVLRNSLLILVMVSTAVLSRPSPQERDEASEGGGGPLSALKPVQQGVGNAVAGVGGAISAIREGAGGAVSGIRNAVERAGGAVSGIRNAVEGVGSRVKGIFDTVRGVIEQVAKVASVIPKAVESVVKLIGGLTRTFGDVRGLFPSDEAETAAKLALAFTKTEINSTVIEANKTLKTFNTRLRCNTKCAPLEVGTQERTDCRNLYCAGITGEDEFEVENFDYEAYDTNYYDNEEEASENSK